MDLFAARSLPFLTRRNYLNELGHLSLWSLLVALIEGQFGAIVVSKSFGGDELLIAIATATPMASLMFSLLWGPFCTGRPKVRLSAILSAGIVLCAGAVAAIPATRAGAVWFIAQLAAAQVLLAGVITIRSAIWRANYPQSDRGQITARLQAVREFVTVAGSMAAAAWCGQDSDAYAYVYPIAAGLGLLGIGFLSRIHVRGQRGEIRRLRAQRAQADRRGEMPALTGVRPEDGSALTGVRPEDGSALTGVRPEDGSAPTGDRRGDTPALTGDRRGDTPALTGDRRGGGRGRTGVIAGMWVILRTDRRFARYMVAQFLMGVANLLPLAALTKIVTQDLPIGDAWAYWVSTALLVALPKLCLMGTITRWGRLFDRVGVVRFRVVNMSCAMLTLVLAMVAVAMIEDWRGDARGLTGVRGWGIVWVMVLLSLRGVLYGLTIAGGKLAWSLGHLHFADAAESEAYMGIHVSLTGVRGLFAPTLGMWLWSMIGWKLWLVSLAIGALSLAMFAQMAAHESRPPAADRGAPTS